MGNKKKERSYKYRNDVIENRINTFIEAQVQEHNFRKMIKAGLIMPESEEQ